MAVVVVPVPEVLANKLPAGSAPNGEADDVGASLGLGCDPRPEKRPGALPMMPKFRAILDHSECHTPVELVPVPVAGWLKTRTSEDATPYLG